jgi:ubiquinone/menaquinone biosynthesis C-methylase UbiE
VVDHKQVYQSEGEKYQLLIDREDYLGNLLPALQNLIRLEGLDMVDLGTGTGRLASILGPFTRRIFAFDRSDHMLGVAISQLGKLPMRQWLVAAADHKAIPLPRDSADMILSGWSFCYLVVWEENDWKASLHEGLKEIKRVLRKEGSVVIIETLGTGNREPQPPDKLKPYFSYLEEQGFQSSWIRTDYQFRNLDEAYDLTAFFFGEEMLENILLEPEPILPECTGIWSLPAKDLLNGVDL